MNRFNPKSRCHKCKSKDVGAKFIRPGTQGPIDSAAWRESLSNVMLRTCRQCGHDWCEKPADDAS